MPLSKKEILAIIEGVRKGYITMAQLPVSLFEEIYRQLELNLERGFDLEVLKTVTPEDILNPYLQITGNLKSFAAHKTWQVMNSVTRQGAIEDMVKTYDKYMTTWQRTENDLVLKQSMTVNDWYVYESQKDVMPYLRYVTAMDERVRDEHEALHGIIKKVDSPFWDEFMPANGYRCRCTVEQLDVAKESVITPQEMSQHKKEVDLKFRNNPAKTGYIFKEEGKDKHPYFKVPKEAKGVIEELK